MKLLRRFRRERRGAIEIITVCLLAALLVVMGLTIDLGHTYVTHLRMRNALDLATAAVGDMIPVGNSVQAGEDIRETVSRVITGCGLDSEMYHANVELTANDTDIYAVKIIITKKEDQYFSAFYAKSDSSIMVGNLVTATPDEAAEHGYSIYVTDA